jgi:hypothetical protein
MTCRRSTVDSAVLLSDEVGSVRDFRLLWCSGDLRSSGLLRSVIYLFTDVSGELPLCIFKDQDLDLRRWDWYAVPKVEILTLEDGIDTLSRNVGTNQPTLCNNPKSKKPKVDQVVTLLIYFHGIGVSNFGWDTALLVLFFVFRSPSRQMSGWHFKLGYKHDF